MIFFSQPGKFALDSEGLDSEGEPDWVLFGVPYDSTSSFNTGARFGPDSIREASRNLEVYDCELKVDLTSVRLRDLGNVNVRLGDPGANFDIVKKAVSEVTREVRKENFIVLGGEHTISYPVVSAVEPDVFISLDAHLDLRDEYLGEPLSHACTSRRIHEICDVHVYGFRECSKEEYLYAQENNLDVYNSLEIDDITYPRNKRIHLSIDMDVLDPSIAPNVSNPVPGGLNFREVVKIVAAIFERNTIVSLDLCEVCSRYADTTAVTAAYLLYKTLALWRSSHE